MAWIFSSSFCGETESISSSFCGETESKVAAEYISTGGSGMDIKSRAITLQGPVSKNPGDLPIILIGEHSGVRDPVEEDVFLIPKAMFCDPFRGGTNILVLCAPHTAAGERIRTNNIAEGMVPWYGIEQEYTLIQKDVRLPTEQPVSFFTGPQGPYCNIAGIDKHVGRDIMDSHYKACLDAGINISGIKGDAMSGKWAFQVGPGKGISAGDQLFAARYILERTAKSAGVRVSFNPKLIQGDWYGADTLTDYGTRSRRSDCGLDVIKRGVEKLVNAFSMGVADWGVANRGDANRGAFIHVGRSAGGAGKVKLD